jgi:hypothetical protein
MNKNAVKTAHYYSGLLLSVFIFMHISNHLLALVSPQSHILFMEKARLIYRQPIIETLLLMAVLLQILSGLKLIKQLKSDNLLLLSDKLRIYSGLYLAFFLIIHVSAVISGRVVFNLDTNIYFGAAGINLFPFNLFFIPYYFLSITAIFTHIACIHYKKAGQYLPIKMVKNQSIIIAIIGIILAFLIIMGMTHYFEGLSIPNEYLDIYKLGKK